MPIIYRIRDWDKYYENSQTRKLRLLQWVPIPIKFSNTGYNRLVRQHPDGASHFAAFITLVQLSATCKPRGVLIQDNGEPHTAESLSLVTHIPESVFSEALPRLAHPSIGWLKLQPLEEKALALEMVESATAVADSATAVADSTIAVAESAKRIEGNGMESDDDSKSASGTMMMIQKKPKTQKHPEPADSASAAGPAPTGMLLRAEVIADLEALGRVSGIAEPCPAHVVESITKMLTTAHADVPTVEGYFQQLVDGIQGGSVNRPRRWPWVITVVRNALKQGAMREIAEGLKGGSHARQSS